MSQSFKPSHVLESYGSHCAILMVINAGHGAKFHRKLERFVVRSKTSEIAPSFSHIPASFLGSKRLLSVDLKKREKRIRF